MYGEGEWKVRQHGSSKHRTWRKIHLAVDESTGVIESWVMITNSVDDAAMAGPLLDSVEGTVMKLAADGAFDKKKVYRELEKRPLPLYQLQMSGVCVEFHRVLSVLGIRCKN